MQTMKTIRTRFGVLSAIAFLLLPAIGQAANLLSNGRFGVVGPLGPFTTITTPVPGGADFSAAEDWTLFTNTAGTITSELLPSSLVPGGTMIHVTTDGQGNGLVQVFGDFDTGPETVYACAWISLVSGEVGIGTGNGGNTGYDMVLKKTGSWEVVPVSNGVSPANEFIIYAHSVGGAEFYVESATVTLERSKCRPR